MVNIKHSRLIQILSLVLAMLMLVQPLTAAAAQAGGFFASQPVGYNQELLDCLTALYGREEALKLLDSLRAAGIIDARGNFLSYQIELDGKKLTTEEALALVNDPDTDLTRKCKVDGKELTLADLKTILEIEEEIERIRELYFTDGVKMTASERKEEIAKLEKKMREAAKMLEFEYAAVLRDQLIKLRGEK